MCNICLLLTSRQSKEHTVGSFMGMFKRTKISAVRINFKKAYETRKIQVRACHYGVCNSANTSTNLNLYKQIKCQVFGVKMLRKVLNATQTNILGISCTIYPKYVVVLFLFQCHVQLIGRQVDE